MDKQIIASYLHPMSPKATRMQPGGSLRQPVRCLLCDIYGTLFISGSGDIGTSHCLFSKEREVKDLLNTYHLPFTPSQLHEQLKSAICAQHRKAKALGADFPEVNIDRLWQKIFSWSDQSKIRAFAAAYEMIVNPVWPMPGIRTLIDHCNRMNIHLGIISNAQFFTPLLFDWFFGTDLVCLGFDPQLAIFSYELGLAKPSPRLFQIAVRRLHQMGIAPNQAAYIGNDMRNDISASQKAGFQTVLFAGDARSLRMRKDDPFCHGTFPDLTITHLDQLEHYLH